MEIRRVFVDKLKNKKQPRAHYRTNAKIHRQRFEKEHR